MVKKIICDLCQKEIGIKGNPQVTLTAKGSYVYNMTDEYWTQYYDLCESCFTQLLEGIKND